MTNVTEEWTNQLVQDNPINPHNNLIWIFLMMKKKKESIKLPTENAYMFATSDKDL